MVCVPKAKVMPAPEPGLYSGEVHEEIHDGEGKSKWMVASRGVPSAEWDMRCARVRKSESKRRSKRSKQD